MHQPLLVLQAQQVLMIQVCEYYILLYPECAIKLFFSVYTKLAVIGGYNFVFGGNLVDVEVLDLQDSRANCDNLANYPAPETGLTAALIDGIIKSCGGHQNDVKACHDYSPESESWSEEPDMIYERVYPRSSIIQGQWLISGDNQSPANEETEIWNGSEFEAGPVLPAPMYHPCQLTLNDTHIFIADMEHHDGFYILDWQTGEWSEKMDMDRTRTWPACGVVKSAANGVEVVIVGEGTSDILNLESMAWREGPGLPYAFDYGYNQVGDTFVLVGGYDGNYLDAVYVFDNDSYQFVQLEQTLKTSRYLPAVVAIPDSFTNCT